MVKALESAYGPNWWDRVDRGRRPEDRQGRRHELLRPLLPALGDDRPLGRGVRQDARQGRAQLRRRAARGPQPLGAPEGRPAVHLVGHRARARHDGAPRDRDQRARAGEAARRDARRDPARRVGGRPEAGAEAPGDPAARGRGGTRPAALARRHRAASRRRRRPLRAGGVRRRPRPGRAWRCRRRVRQPAPLLRAHLPDRRPVRPPDHRAAAARRQARGRPGRRAPDELRRRQDALDARALPPGLGHARDRAARGRADPRARPASRSCRRVRRAVLVGTALSPGQPHRGGRPRDPHALGRARLAARRRGRATASSPRPTRTGSARDRTSCATCSRSTARRSSSSTSG